MPAGVLNVVTTPSNDVASILGTDPRVDMISFTGSTAVGKLLMRQGADTMKRMFLELGGKSVAIVLDDANPAAILGAAIGVCVHAGQACAATTRMLVHRSLTTRPSPLSPPRTRACRSAIRSCRKPLSGR